MRWILEGRWSGYHPRQERVVHRAIIKKNPERYKDLSCIRYTDGTCLYLTLREAKPRERVEVIKSYATLIEDCIRQGVSSVAELYNKDK